MRRSIVEDARAFNLDIRQIYKHYRISALHIMRIINIYSGSSDAAQSSKYTDFNDLCTADEIFETKTCYSLPYCGFIASIANIAFIT